jgi:mannose-6-phosphate isomerase-like protein (cupin superfamily)
MNRFNKIWGYEDIYCNNEHYCFKELVLNPGFISSYHKHQKKDECFLIGDDSNDIYFSIEGVPFIACPGDFIHVPPNYAHEFAALGCVGQGYFYEVSSHDDPADSYRETQSRAINFVWKEKGYPYFGQLLGHPMGFDNSGTPMFGIRGHE